MICLECNEVFAPRICKCAGASLGKRSICNDCCDCGAATMTFEDRLAKIDNLHEKSLEAFVNLQFCPHCDQPRATAPEHTPCLPINCPTCDNFCHGLFENGVCTNPPGRSAPGKRRLLNHIVQLAVAIKNCDGSYENLKRLTTEMNKVTAEYMKSPEDENA